MFGSVTILALAPLTSLLSLVGGREGGTDSDAPPTFPRAELSLSLSPLLSADGQASLPSR